MWIVSSGEEFIKHFSECIEYFEKKRYDVSRNMTERTYELAIAEGDKNVYYVNPLDTFPIVPEECTVDRIHPTDLGFYFMAKALEPTLKEIAKKYK